MSVDLAALVSTAFKTVGANVKNVSRTVVYRTAGTQTYDPATGTLTTASTDYTVQAIFTGFKREERDGDYQNSRRVAVELGDQKCLIPFSSLPVTPTMEDHIIDGTSVWRILDFSVDPTGSALLTLHLRQG